MTEFDFNLSGTDDVAEGAGEHPSPAVRQARQRSTAMAQIVSGLLEMDKAEEAIAEIWMYVERSNLEAPVIRLEFDSTGERLRMQLGFAGGAPSTTVAFLRMADSLAQFRYSDLRLRARQPQSSEDNCKAERPGGSET